MTVYEGVVCCRYLLIDGCDIYLAAVLAALLVAGADEDVRDVLPEARLLVHGLALRVVDDGQVHLLQHRRQRAVCNGELPSPVL